MKKTIILICISLFINSCTNNTTSNNINYYENLKKDCENKNSSNCCISSVDAMESGKYELAKTDKHWNDYCEQWFQKNLLRCIDSYTWCEPIK